MKRFLLGGLILGVLAVFIVIKMTLPREFVWNQWDCMRSDDDNPLGCMLFEEMAKETMPKGYEVLKGDLEELFDRNEPFAMLMMNGSLDIDGGILLRIDSLVRSGCKLMIVAQSTRVGEYKPLVQWLAETEIQNSFDEDQLRDALQGNRELVAVDMIQGDAIHVPDVFLTHYFSSMGKQTKVTASFIGCNEYQEVVSLPIAVKTKVEKGMVYQISCPLLMTNYGLFYHNIQKFQQQQMAQIADMPVVRIPQSKLRSTSDNDQVDVTDSPLAYMLERPPLRWALYTVFAAILLFMFFSARRRQRVIPLVERPRNRNIDFVKLIGTIYYRRHDNADLAKKKYIYFREEMRRSLLIDIGDAALDNKNFRKLAQKTGLDEERVGQAVRRLRELAEREDQVGDEELYDCIDQINEIIKHL